MVNQACYSIYAIPYGWAIDNGNCRMYLLKGEKEALLLDTGYGDGDLAGLVRHLSPGKTTVVLTHNHFDHIGGIRQFADAYVHVADMAEVAEKAPDVQLHPLQGGEEFELGGLTMEVLHTPGHTPGSISLRVRQTGDIFSGDNVSDRPVFMCFSGADLVEYCQSLETLIRHLPKGGSFYGCHGRMVQSAERVCGLRDCVKLTLEGKLTPQPTAIYTGELKSLYEGAGGSFYY